MVDKPKIRLPIFLNSHQLVNFTHNFKCEPNKTPINKYYLNTVARIGKGSGDAPISFEYYPGDYQGNPALVMEFSVPRLMYGSNYHMIFSIGEAINTITPIFKAFSFLPPIDIGVGVVRVNIEQACLQESPTSSGNIAGHTVTKCIPAENYDFSDLDGYTLPFHICGNVQRIFLCALTNDMRKDWG